MPAYNCGQFIEESIRSVISQSYESWELIVVNDCSSDNTLAILEKIQEPRITIISNKINMGVADTRNVAIGTARGQYISFLDSDDLWLPEKLTKQVKALQANSKAVCSHTSFLRMDEQGKYLCDVKAIEKVTLSLMRKGNFIGNLTGLIDRQRAGTVLQKKIKHEDYLMWLNVLEKQDGCYSIGIADVLAKYRVCESSVSSNKFKSVSWHWKILRQEQNMNIFIASYYLSHYIFYAIKKRQ